MNDESSASAGQVAKWKPLSAVDRRLVGVLVEKAKTTPEQYPLSISGLRAGANQKNNRYPLMELELEDIEESLARLRGLGAVTEVQAGGRVAKFRHHLYEWLGVEKIELAVMTELLLRGAQTEGELRGRADRMESIADLAALRPILASLKAKGLVIALTPEGRGHMVTHALYQPQELEKIKAEVAAGASAPRSDEGGGHTAGTSRASSADAVEQLRRELEEVRSDVAALRRELDELRSSL